MTLMVILTAKICFILRLTHSECWIYNIIVYNENIITYWFISITRFSLFGARQVKDVPIRWGWRVGWTSRGGVLMISKKDVPLKWTGVRFLTLMPEIVRTISDISHYARNHIRFLTLMSEIVCTISNINARNNTYNFWHLC